MDFEETKDSLKIVLLKVDGDKYIYSVNLTEQRLQDTWGLVTQAVTESGNNSEKFLQGIIRRINIAYDSQTWPNWRSLINSLQRFGFDAVEMGI